MSQRALRAEAIAQQQINRFVIGAGRKHARRILERKRQRRCQQPLGRHRTARGPGADHRGLGKEIALDLAGGVAREKGAIGRLCQQGGETIVVPRAITQPDYEGELAVVIGRRGRDIPEGSALDYVAGYLPLNDVSAR